MWEVFEKLCRERGVTANRVARDTGIPQTTLSNWKQRRNLINGKAAQKIAEYFDVTLEYLMTGKDTPILLYTDIEMGEYNAEVRKLMEVLNHADIDTVRRLRYYAEGLIAARKDQT